jgi:hypothetical protein
MFLAQGKNSVEILREFRMEDCRLMATHLVTNLINVFTSYLEFLDTKIYMKVIETLMYLVNTMIDICVCSLNTLS